MGDTRHDEPSENMRKELGISLPFQLVEIIISIVCLKRTSFIIWLCMLFGFYFCVTSLTRSYFHLLNL